MRLGDLDALKNHLEDLRSYTILGEEHPYYSGETNALSVAIQNIENAPTVDAVPVKHGRWKLLKIGGASYPFWDNVCSICDWQTSRVGACDYRFCPNCGAKMGEERRESDAD